MEKLKTKKEIKESGSERGSGFLKLAAGQALFFILGFALGSFSFAGGLAPFAAGFAAGVPHSFLLSSAIGSALGSFSALKLVDSLSAVTAVCIAAFIRMGFNGRVKREREMLFTGLLAFFASALSCAAVFYACGQTFIFLMTGAAQAVVSAAFACFVKRSCRLAGRGISPAAFSSADSAAALFTAGVLLAAVGRYRLFGFSAGEAAAVFAVLMCTRSGQPMLSALAGACAGSVFGLSGAPSELMPSFVLGGLASGISAGGGKAASAAAFFCASLLSAILSGEPESVPMFLLEAAVGEAAFMLAPMPLLSRAAHSISPRSPAENVRAQAGLLSFRLTRCAKAFRDTAACVSSVSKLLARLEKPSPDSIAQKAADEVCSDCPKHAFCWTGADGLTKKALEEAKRTVLKNGSLTENTLPERLKLICRKKTQMVICFNRSCCEYAARLAARGEINESKIAASQLLCSAAQLLEDKAGELNAVPDEYPALAAAAKSVMQEFGIDAVKVSAAKNACGRTVLEAYCPSVPPLPDVGVLLERLYDATQTVFMPPSSDEYASSGRVLSFCEEAAFSVEFSVCSHPGTGEEYSGDSYECFFDGRGSFYAVLSDGMGTGGLAAVDSVMTCTLTSRLLRSGFSPEAAKTAVNSALMIKSADETLATLDIMKIDLDTGRTVFYKAGAAASVVRRGGKALAVELSSSPLGILTDAALKSGELVLGAGDITVMMSDGAGLLSLRWFKDMFGRADFSSPENIADITVKQALSACASGRNDDITVICAKLVKN